MPTEAPESMEIIRTAAGVLAMGKPIEAKDIVGLSLVSALWCRYFAGTSDSGRQIVFNDASAEKLHEAALKAKDNPEAFLAFDEIFGEVSSSALFRERFAHALKTLWTEGTAKTLQLYLADQFVG